MTTTKETTCSQHRLFRFLYGAFVLLGLYYLIFRQDPGSAISNLGIALVFDPFDQRVRWNDRPLYQRVWLVVHLVLVFVVLGMALLG
jgi:hypothetical protein